MASYYTGSIAFPKSEFTIFRTQLAAEQERSSAHFRPP
jgi:hypothetical protein